MVFGLIYGYFKGTQCVYVGRTIGVNSAKHALSRRHKAHMRGYSPFDNKSPSIVPLLPSIRMVYPTDYTRSYAWNTAPLYPRKRPAVPTMRSTPR